MSNNDALRALFKQTTKRHNRLSFRTQPMACGGPSAARLSNRLFAILSAAAASGCTLISVESSLNGLVSRLLGRIVLRHGLWCVRGIDRLPDRLESPMVQKLIQSGSINFLPGYERSHRLRSK